MAITLNPIELHWGEHERGAFVIEDGGHRLAEMEMAINGSNMIVYHTEVAEELKGQGVAGKLLEEMVEYARKNQLKVIPLCPYVNTQFKRHPDQYADVWNKGWKG